MEEDKDNNEQNIEEEIEDWDGNIQKQKDFKEQELKNNNNKTTQSSPGSMSTSTSDTNNTEILTPQFTNTLVTSGNGEQKEDNSEDNSEDSEDFEDSEDTLDNIG